MRFRDHKRRTFIMRTGFLIAAAGALALSPASLAAQAAPGQGQFNGSGWDHMNGPDATGQPGAECEDLIEDGEGAFPGHAADNGHSAFGGSAGDVYAGSQPQNSRNSASVSQYDTACLHQEPQG
jgi:hypothetical protein